MKAGIKIHCVFCGGKLEVTLEKRFCRSCKAWFELSVEDGCVKKVTVARCGEECTCYEKDKAGQ